MVLLLLHPVETQPQSDKLHMRRPPQILFCAYDIVVQMVAIVILLHYSYVLYNDMYTIFKFFLSL